METSSLGDLPLQLLPAYVRAKLDPIFGPDALPDDATQGDTRGGSEEQPSNGLGSLGRSQMSRPQLIKSTFRLLYRACCAAGEGVHLVQVRRDLRAGSQRALRLQC